MRKKGKACRYIILSVMIASCNYKAMLPAVEIKKLNYPSASAVEYYNGKLYVMGDDAKDMIVLDKELNVIDSIHFINYPERRILKSIKHDPEASALYTDSTGTSIFLFGSGSTSPFRDSVLAYHFEKKIKGILSLDTFYSQIKRSRIEQINIEGASIVADKLFLVSRGNKSYPKNFLIVTDAKFWTQSSNYPMSTMPFEEQQDTAAFKGISGLCYSKEKDRLIMTVSTEDTRSVHEDGAIGKSYLWMVDSISGKLNSTKIKTDKVIDLETIDPRFKGQKIESATIIEETKSFMHLVLVADNDDGSSTIFKMTIKMD